jgi:hypothetical protein
MRSSSKYNGTGAFSACLLSLSAMVQNNPWMIEIFNLGEAVF